MGIKERKEREKAQRSRQIQQAAKGVFWERGYNAATIEEIAYRAELSPATLYTYFKSKDELFASLLLIPTGYLYQQIAKVYENESLSDDEKILGYKRAMLKTFRHDRLMLKNILHFQVENSHSVLSQDLLKEINEKVRGVMDMIADTCERAVCEKRYIEGHRKAYADIIWGYFTGILMWEEAKRKFSPEKDFLESTLDFAFDIFLRGVKREHDKMPTTG